MNKNIVCIGAGYIGGPTMAVIALKNPGRKIYVVDVSKDRIAAWNSPNLPIYEPGLDEIVRKVRGRNLFFTTDIDGAIRNCDIIFVGVNTPTKMFGRGAGRASDLQYWEAAARNISAVANRDKIVIEKSTLPVRTAEAMAKILEVHPQHHFTVLSNPEFLAEGTAIKDLLDPDRVLIGGPRTPAGEKAVKALVDIYAAWVPREKILTTNLWSAELSKLAANAMLAQRVSSVNALSALCEATGADGDEVAKGRGADRRIGPKCRKAGPGFGGSCFRKDVLNLVYLCETYGLKPAADYWQHVIAMNDWQQERIVTHMLETMFHTVANKKIAVFGFAFKADTGDTRETPALHIIDRLEEERARVTVTDPKALGNAKRDLAKFGDKIVYEANPYKAAAGADAIVLMTDWAQYPKLDWQKIRRSMRTPAFIFDTRNCLPAAALRKLGFTLFGVGK